ncbi:hypothetical protein NO357_06180 [Marimonas arenosa]|uniref:Uncharacterized protein n=1 Tax=Marimonas arenosa TaxID=1795305 RepID=A0AAE3WBK6_9RHOB|nr:hypothetical protein [Marimonas arenosa]
MRDVFSSRDAIRGGVIKRQVRDAERPVGRDVFPAEVARRGRQAPENGYHIIVCCGRTHSSCLGRAHAGGRLTRAFAFAPLAFRLLLLLTFLAITPAPSNWEAPSWPTIFSTAS